MCNFCFWIEPCRNSTTDIDTPDITSGHPLLFFLLFFFRPKTTPVSNTHLLFSSFLGNQCCVHVFNILLLIYRYLSYHTCIADCCVSPWRYIAEVKQQLMDLCWNKVHVSYWFNIKQSIPNHVSFYQGMHFLLAFP